MSQREVPLQDDLLSPVPYQCSNVNATSGKQCLKNGDKVCSCCKLVLYCSKECQKSHWKTHKTDCKSQMMKMSWQPSWEGEQRKPVFVYDYTSPADSTATHGKQKFLWGNVPALDVLKLEHNEGATYDKDIRLLFAASGDLRHVVKTVAGIPSTSPQSFTAVVNDRDFDIVARNAILLLTALHVEPASAAAVAMLHIWYSALIPSAVLQCLHTTVVPLIRGVCDKLTDRPADRLLAKTFTRGACSVRLVLEKRCWDALQAYLEVPAGLTAEEAQRTRTKTVLADARKDYLERALFCQPPGWRGASMRFRHDGVLVPFGASRMPFDTPNPTFFQQRDVWPMMDSADPLSGWSLDDVLWKTSLAKNDLYGGLFFHVRELLAKFCSKLQKLKISFVLFCADVVDLPKMLSTDCNLPCSFDRIEVANIADRGYLGLKCLNIFAPLLQPLKENPCAVLVTLFLNAVREVETEADTMETMMRERGRVMAYLPPTRPLVSSTNKSANAQAMRHLVAYNLLNDFDGLFTRYMQVCCFGTVASYAGVRQKPNHTIVEPWPLRLRKDATKEDFERVLGSSHSGSERYVEWQRAV